MTTQALTLVTPVPASAPPTAAAQPSADADSFASVLASQHEGADGSDTATDAVLATPGQLPFNKHKNESVSEPSSHADDDTDSALSLIATTLFIAAESASIQQGLRPQQVATEGTEHGTSEPRNLLTDTLLQSAETRLHTAVQPAAKRVSDLRSPQTTTATVAAPVIPAVRSTDTSLDTETVAMADLAKPATVKTVSAASLLSTAHVAAKQASNTDTVKAVLTSLPAATNTLPNTQVETAVHTLDIPAVTTAITNTASSITTAAAPSTSPVLQASLNQPLDSASWGQEFSKTMLSFSRQGVQHAELRLDPPELGPLRISLKLSDNIAHAYIVSAHANVRQAVEQALPQLQQALAQNGLSLGQADVSDQPSDQGFFAQQHDDGSGTNSASSSRFDDLLHGRSSATTETIAPAVRRAIPDALIDTFA
ncbi:flagellar hook-length control protein FliK [Paenalcaligenes sp. Me131]|uniref:flagellar hook-length control protein FliK n=1 Tax=Paenalcaligenes sp. Me131 TaxID=3392636 RepID=UPI003D28D7DA